VGRRRAALKSVASLFAVVAETPFEAGTAGPAMAGVGSPIVTTSTAIVANTTLRPAEQSNPWRINIFVSLYSGRFAPYRRRIAAAIQENSTVNRAP
jgi:hypothetical protein